MENNFDQLNIDFIFELSITYQIRILKNIRQKPFFLTVFDKVYNNSSDEKKRILSFFIEK